MWLGAFWSSGGAPVHRGHGAIRRSGRSSSQLLVGVGVLVLPGMLVRWSAVAPRSDRRSDLASEAQDLEEVKPNPVWALAQLRCFGFGLVTVRHADLVGLIRITRPSTHPSQVIGGRIALAPISGFQGFRSPWANQFASGTQSRHRRLQRPRRARSTRRCRLPPPPPPQAKHLHVVESITYACHFV